MLFEEVKYVFSYKFAPLKHEPKVFQIGQLLIWWYVLGEMVIPPK